MADIIEHPTPEQQQHVWAEFKRALKDGRLTKPKTCAWCGATAKRINGHHPDYARPLMVVWLCTSCHIKHHQEYAIERTIRQLEAARVP
jgi:hypothetical protein